MAWILYLSDLFIGLRVIFTAPWFIQVSESRVDLIINVVAISFILNIDDYVSKIFSHLSFGTANIAVRDVLDTDVFDLGVFFGVEFKFQVCFV